MCEVWVPVLYVDVPQEYEKVFERAEALVRDFFSGRVADPREGVVAVRGERYVGLRAKALSVEFFRLVRGLYGEGRHEDADEFARHLLFDLAHAVGRSDAAHFAQVMNVEDKMDLLAAGPVGFAWSGWAKVKIDPESRPGDDFLLRYDHNHSFECDSWMSEHEESRRPVCIMNAGYSSGWCSRAFDVDLVAVEVQCRACGDDRCHFIMAPPSRLDAHLSEFLDANPDGRSGVIPAFFVRKRLQDELIASRAELEQEVEERTRELTEANARLLAEMERRERVERQLVQAQKLEALGRLAGGVAHDFNNLLSVVLGRIELMQMRMGPGDDSAAGADAIIAACERGAELTKQLMSVSQDQVSHPEPLELAEVVSRSASFVASLLGDDIEVAVDDVDDVIVLADRSQVDQIVLNLASNAREAMPTGGLLTLEILYQEVREDGLEGLAPGTYGVLRVTDNGVGMDANTLARAFDPFFTTRPNQGGSGLGLSIVHAVAVRHAGTATVTSALGEGTTISVYLPATRRHPHATPGLAPRRTAIPTDRGRTVMVVEDEAPLRILLDSALRRWGYRTVVAGGADEALEYLSTQPGPLHLLLTDVVMLGMGGRDLADRVLAFHPEAEVIFMSGHNDDELLRRGIEQQRVHFLQKPFRLPALADMLHDVLKSQGDD